MKESNLNGVYLFRSLIPLLIFFFYSSFFAQEIIQTEFISLSDGLTSGTVQPIIQDSYGLMWVGTDAGLHKYDGYKFTRYKNIPGQASSLLNDNIFGITEDSEKNLWISTDEGISKYERKKNEFKNYDFAELLPNGGARAFNVFIDSQDRIWASALKYGVLRYDKKNDAWNQVPFWSEDSNKAVMVNSYVMQIAEDKKGKIWAGFNRYGLAYYNDSDSAFSPFNIRNGENIVDFTLSENLITYIYADLTNTLWMTTRSGIYKFDQKTNTLGTIKEYDYAKLVIWNHWNKILQDNSGNIWIANNFRGILKFDGISDEFKEINIFGRQRRQNNASDINITRATVDNTGIIWFGTTLDGIMKYDSSREPFINYKYDESDKNSISSNQVFGLLESRVKKGKIYVGTRGGGLNLFDQQSEKFTQIEYKVINDQFGGSIRSIAEEADGSLLLGTWGDGLVHLDKNLKEVNRFVRDTSSSESLANNQVRVIKKDNNDKYWIGTNNGLNLLDLKSNQMSRIGTLNSRVYKQQVYQIAQQYLKSKKFKASIEKVGDLADLTKSFNVIKPRKYLVISGGEGTFDDNLMYDYGWIVNSKNDTIWGSNDATKTFHLGGASKNRVVFDIIDLKPGSYNLRYKSDDSHSYDAWNNVAPKYPQFWGIHAVELDNDSEAKQIANHILESENEFLIKGDNIRSIHISKNFVWIGTDAAGINKINLDDNTVKTYSHDKESDNTLSNNSVQFIHEDANGILWLATNSGLNKFDPVRETFKVYTEDDGLPTNYIASILPGDNSDLWIATRNGISKMVTDQETEQVTFVNYDTQDGIVGMDFIALVALKASNGEYFFGSEQGLSAFTPGNSNTTEPNLIFTDLKISNKSVKSYSADESPIETALIELDKLDLAHDQNDLTFSFAALHYSNPSKNQYAHKLIGYDKDWVFDNKREVTYTNLDPGEYSFSIKGSNRDGVWKSTPKTIEITIHPPWWLTTWAYIGYGLFLILGIFAIDRIQRRRLLNKAKERMKIQDAEHRAEAAELQAKATESERRALELEFNQKKKELDEARNLQLSMLPKVLPQLPQLDIAVYMKTATEVGGDYYDFNIGLDGTLTCVLGDATGHGMKAGTMVTAVKGLFNSYGANPDILYSFHEISRCIKQMQLEKLSMCMTMVKINNNKLLMSAAGMPPILIYKQSEKSVSEHVMKGMPLGTFDKYPYDIREERLNSGDTLLLMSDGFPELLNSEGELYGYQRVRNSFENVAEKSPEEIINSLKDEGSKWIGVKDPDDDVTFVVIKVK
jgi:serine phosphatase RsbU (regulator of sigma subunit)/ligand-binding sensor domain-containing protein